MDLWFGFHVGFHVLLWKTLLARFAGRVTSPGSWNLGWRVLMLVLRWDGSRSYGVYTVFDSPRVLFISAGLEARFQRAVLPALASGGRVTSELQEMFKPCSRERSARAPRASFKLSEFRHRPQAAGPIRASVWGGSPAHVQAFWGGIYVIRYSIHSMEDTNLQILYACLVTHDAKA